MFARPLHLRILPCSVALPCWWPPPPPLPPSPPPLPPPSTGPPSTRPSPRPAASRPAPSPISIAPPAPCAARRTALRCCRTRPASPSSAPRPSRPTPASWCAKSPSASSTAAAPSPSTANTQSRSTARSGAAHGSRATEHAGSLDAPPAPPALTPPFRHPREGGDPPHHLHRSRSRRPLPFTGEEGRAQRGGGGGHTLRCQPRAPLLGWPNDPLGSLGQSRKAITPQSALPPLHGKEDRQSSPDLIWGGVGARLHRPPGAARSPLSRPSWPDLIRPPSRTRSTRGRSAGAAWSRGLKSPKRTALRCCRTRPVSP